MSDLVGNPEDRFSHDAAQNVAEFCSYLSPLYDVWRCFGELNCLYMDSSPVSITTYQEMIQHNVGRKKVMKREKNERNSTQRIFLFI